MFSASAVQQLNDSVDCPTATHELVTAHDYIIDKMPSAGH